MYPCPVVSCMVEVCIVFEELIIVKLLPVLEKLVGEITDDRGVMGFLDGFVQVLEFLP